MKNFETHHPVVGSSALKSHYSGVVIDFPVQGKKDVPKMHDEKDAQPIRMRLFIDRFINTWVVQTLLHGSIQGKPFTKTKPWQSALVGTCFFVIAFACIYIGR